MSLLKDPMRAPSNAAPTSPGKNIQRCSGKFESAANRCEVDTEMLWTPATPAKSNSHKLAVTTRCGIQSRRRWLDTHPFGSSGVPVRLEWP